MLKKTIAVGSEIDSYCGKCKMVLNHIVAAMVESEPRRVRCLTCQSEHNHRLPSVKKTRAKSSSKKSTSSSSSRARNSSVNRWATAMTTYDGSDTKSYSIFETFQVDEWISHSKFGQGMVIEIPGPDRIITLFESGEKMLMQGKQRKS